VREGGPARNPGCLTRPGGGRLELMLELRGVTKRFPGVTALDAVDLKVEGGRTHVLLGENGAGKSTMAQVIAGVLQPDSGDMVFKGRTITHLSRHHARTMGISAVFQELSVVPGLTVWENLFLGRELGRLGFIDKRRMRVAARAVLERLQFPVEPRSLVRELPRAQQQMVEIAKALLTEPEVLILDEPTSALAEADAERLFEIVAELRTEGVAVIYITHRMGEIRRLADAVTVLRDGRVIGTVDPRERSDDQFVEMMAGREVADLYPEISFDLGDPLLRLDGIATANGRLREVSIEAKSGEIVGIAGLVGSGKEEIGRAAVGLSRTTAGRVEVRGMHVERPTPRTMLARGVCYLPGDRRTEGLVHQRSVMENLSLACLSLRPYRRAGFLRRRYERETTSRVAAQLRVRTPSLSRMVSVLSGGNQQKVMFGRALLRDVHVFIFEEPTTGIDMPSRVEIYNLLRDLASAGAAVVLISSDLPEVINLSHRVFVIRMGRVVAELVGGDVTEVAVLSNAFEVGSKGEAVA
jgi:ribose transport system ATP-binding protein